jgi:hypothetical protein
MHKVFQKRAFWLMLPGICLSIIFLFWGGKAYAQGESSRNAVVGTNTEKEGTSATLLTPTCTGQRKPDFGQVVNVNGGETICGDLTLFGGKAVINGEVDGDLIAFGGNVVVDGRITGDITAYGGNLTLLPHASIDGDIRICGGHWAENASVTLHGSVIDCATGIQAVIANSTGAIFRFWSVLIWSIVGSLLTLFLPEHVMVVRTTIKNKARRSFVLGLLSLLLVPIILTVLIALIVSLPLAIFLVIVLGSAWVLGTVAIGRMVGEYILRLCALQHSNPLVQVVLGLVVLTLISSLPYIGWVVSIGLGTLGLGAVLLSRFGTRFYNQPKRLLPL